MNEVSGKTKIAGLTAMAAGAALHLGAKLHHRWVVECLDAEGHQLWVVERDNLVTTAGLNKYLDATLKTGLTSPTWFVALVDNASFSAYSAADVMSSHAGWIELNSCYSGARPAWTPGSVSAGSVDNSAAKASFTMTGSGTIRGLFMTDSSTRSGTTGTLLGEVDLGTAQPVISTNVVNAQLTCSLS